VDEAFPISKGTGGHKNGQHVIKRVVSMQKTVFHTVVVGKLVASLPCQVLTGHPCFNEKFDRIVESRCGNWRMNACDVAADCHHVQLILAPRPKAGSVGKSLKVGESLLQVYTVAVDIVSEYLGVKL
jgi:hypothetical protein